VDFTLGCCGPDAAGRTTIVLDESARPLGLALSSRWKKPVMRVHLLTEGLQGIASMVEAAEAEHVILASLSSVTLIDPSALNALVCASGDHVVKVSVGRTPIEMYCGRRERLARLLSSAAAHEGSGGNLRESLFNRTLHAAIDLIEDVPGDILFQNDLMQCYAANIWIIAHNQSARFHTALARLPALAQPGPESHIAEKGVVRSSWLASGVEVEGVVEDSILFPGVLVRRGALVSRSVILSGNRIGGGTEIHNALILPFTDEVPRPTPNIGDRCVIGAARASTMKNADFPTQIRDGIAVIGMNSDLPNGFHAEPASLVAPGVPAAVLRRLKVARKGTCVMAAHAATEYANGTGEKR
jgi:hypothetical protein